jgi:hypothetical protein
MKKSMKKILRTSPPLLPWSIAQTIIVSRGFEQKIEHKKERKPPLGYEEGRVDVLGAPILLATYPRGSDYDSRIASLLADSSMVGQLSEQRPNG